jgi:hypothetical protein
LNGIKINDGVLDGENKMAIYGEGGSAAGFTKKIIEVIVAAMIAFTILPYAQTQFTSMNLSGVLGFTASLAIVLLTFGVLLYIVDKVL